MNTKTFIFPPQFLQLTDETAFGWKLHEFQAIIRDVLDRPEDCLFIAAPTASGKTLSFVLPSACNKLTIRRAKTLIISPTNLLIAQTYEDIIDLIGKNPEIKDMKLSRINSKSFVGMGFLDRAKKIRNDFTYNDIIISNPDIIALFLSGFYDLSNEERNKTEFTRARSTTDIFSELDVVIFDEYHVYSEEELGKIAALINLSQLNGKIPKLIFTSATPQYKFKELLTAFRFTCFEYHVISSNEEVPNSRRIRGEIELTITDQHIMESLTPNVNSGSKVLFLFDHKIDAERSRKKLIEMGLDGRYIQDLTGFSNRATVKPSLTGDERCIIATNAAEQGLNLDVSISHIEPGTYIENLTQRYGRIGRNGKPGAITIHLSNFQAEKISDRLSDFSDLVAELEGIFFKKDVFLSRIKRHFAAFMALCTIGDKRGILAQQIEKSVQITKDITILTTYRAILGFNETVKELSNMKEPHPGDILDLKKWWGKFLLSIGFFRGQSMDIVVGLERDEGIMKTTDSIIWVKKWCTTQTIGEGKDQFCLIKSFKEVPSSVELKFHVPQDTMQVAESNLHDRQKFAQTYYKNISKFIQTAFEDCGIDISQMLIYFQKVIDIIYPQMLMPLEVERASESQII